MLHIPGNKFTVLEVEKDALEPVFHYLQDTNIKDIFLEPTEKEMALYVNDKTNAIILKKLIRPFMAKTGVKGFQCSF